MCRTLWPHSEVDLWPFWSEMLSFYPIVHFCCNYRMNSLVTATVTLNFNHQNVFSWSLSPGGWFYQNEENSFEVFLRYRIQKNVWDEQTTLLNILLRLQLSPAWRHKRRTHAQEIQRSAKLLRNSFMLLGASNNSVPPWHCSSRGRGTTDGGKSLWKTCCSRVRSRKPNNDALLVVSSHTAAQLCSNRSNAWFALNTA